MIGAGLTLHAVAFATMILLIRIGRLHPLSIAVVGATVVFFLFFVKVLLLLSEGYIQWLLTEDEIGKTLLYSAAFSLALQAGWVTTAPARTPSRWAKGSRTWDDRMLFNSAAALGGLGIALMLIFFTRSGGVIEYYSAVHGAAGAWSETTAYVYLGQLLVFPAIVIMLGVVVRSGGKPHRWALLSIFVALAAANATLTASRGWVFALIASVCVTYMIEKRRRPSVVQLFAGAMVAIVVVASMLVYRDRLHLGGTMEGAPSLLEGIESHYRVGEKHAVARVIHGEFLMASATISAVDRAGKLNYGVDLLYNMTVHLIPRKLWPDKPPRWRVGVTSNQIEANRGVRVAGGQASTIIGDSYRQFGYFGLLLAFLIGKVSARLFDRAWREHHPVYTLAYVLLFCFSLHLFAQGMRGAQTFFLFTFIPGFLMLKVLETRVKPLRLRPSRQRSLYAGRVSVD